MKRITLFLALLLLSGCSGARVGVSVDPTVVMREDHLPIEIIRVGAHVDVKRNVGMSLFYQRNYLRPERDDDYEAVLFQLRFRHWIRIR